MRERNVITVACPGCTGEIQVHFSRQEVRHSQPPCPKYRARDRELQKETMGRASYLWTCHYFGARWWRKICELAPAGAPLVEVCEAAARAAVEGEPAERRPTILMAWGAAQLIAEEHDNHEPLRWLQGLGLAPDPHTTPIGDLVDVLDSMRADAARPKETH